MNYLPTAQEIYVVAEFEYIPELKADFLDATLSNLVPDCARLETFLEKTVQSFVSRDYAVTSDGYILNARKHMDALLYDDNVANISAKRAICTMEAITLSCS